MSTTMKLSVITVTMLAAGYLIGNTINKSQIASVNAKNKTVIVDLQNQLEKTRVKITQLKEQSRVVDLSDNQISSTQPYNSTEEQIDFSNSNTVEETADEEADLTVATTDVNELINEVMYQSLNDDVTDETRDQLTQMIAEDPLANEQVLQAYLHNPHSPLGENLKLILGEFRDENIESAAFAMTAPGNDPQDRLAGLELLQQMGVESGETLDVALTIINQESDVQLVGAALDTLQRQVVSPAKNREIRESILPLLADSDAETRRKSVIAYSDWVSTSDNANPIVAALDDPSVDVRAGAAFALGKVPTKSTNMRNALVQRVGDSNEDWAVREQAWFALADHEMDETSHQVYAEFKAQLDQQGEGG